MSQQDEFAEESEASAEDAKTSKSTDPLLCEVAWEVCQQVGGIYTVIRSKIPSMVKRWDRNYCVIGPYNPHVSPAEFEECRPVAPFTKAIKAVQDMGAEVKYGTWLVTGKPRTILFNPESIMGRLGEIKYLLWEHHGINLPADDHLLNQVVAFGFLVENFFRHLTDKKVCRRPIIAHFHEWMASSAIGEIRRAKLPLAVVFTTHATLLGRFVAMSDPWFYDHVPFINWEADAKRYNVDAQVRIERAAAHGSHAFTTLSEITAFECEHLLGRKPDILLPNGLNIERFVAMHEFQNLHLVYKEKINQFVMAHFFPSYSFDLDKTLYFFSSGRFEYRNKGFDLTIESLARLNGRLRQQKSDRTIIFFLVTRQPYRCINAEVLRMRAVMEELRDTCTAIKDHFGQQLFLSAAKGKFPNFDELMDDYWRLRLRRMMHAWKAHRLPAIVTHDLVDDARDEVLNQLRTCQLINRQEDPVKVVYHPEFITPTDPLFGMDYDQFVRGCHLGIFPGAYEPWGYTPLECVARGIPAVTSDLSGFGTYVLQNIPDHQQRGIFVVRRRNVPWNTSAEELTDWLNEYVRLERRERIAQRNMVESSADHFDWNNLSQHYAAAHRLARQRAEI